MLNLQLYLEYIIIFKIKAKMFKVSNLTVEFNNKIIVNDISFNFPPGSINVLMGPNGCGKSTLAYALLGHPNFTITKGEVSLAGQEILSLPTEKRARAGLFLAAQSTPEIPGVQVFTFLKEAHKMLTGQDLSVQEFRNLAQIAFDQVNLDIRFLYRNLNDGFSGGEKKRFEMAQLLLFKPKVAILDEIDSGLDVDGVSNIAKIIGKAQIENPEIIFLIITHYARVLEGLEMDQVLLMKSGSIIKSGKGDLAQNICKAGYN